MSALTTILNNTWRGLVQRRLWPVAALLLAALVAVPVILKAQPEPQPAPAGDQAVAARSAELASEPIVASASASERETVRRVLGARKDPFRPEPQPKKKKKSGAKSAATSGETAAIADPPSNETGGSGGGTGSGIGATTPAPSPTLAAPKPKYDTYSLTVRWGSSDAEELEPGNLKRLGALPSPDEPVLIYLGLLPDGKTAVFMVDAKATADGDGSCKPDPANCETIELREGETEFFDVEDESGAVEQYQLDLVKIHRKKTADAKAAHKAHTAEAPGGRRALRSLRDRNPAYRYDVRTGLLDLVDDDS